jgi:hypothetical protein
MRWVRGGVCVIVLSAGAVLAGQVVAQTPAKQGCQEDFRTADRNGDNRIDRGEFHARVVEEFFLLDKGKKGFLLQEEVIGVRPEVFKAANRKGDGKLTLQEFVNAPSPIGTATAS